MQALQRTGDEAGLKLRGAGSGQEPPTRRKKSALVDKATGALWRQYLSGLTFAMWGPAFKPNTDDTRRGAEPGGDPRAAGSAVPRWWPMIRWQTHARRGGMTEELGTVLGWQSRPVECCRAPMR